MTTDAHEGSTESIESLAERRRFERQPLIIEINFDGGTITGTAMTRDIGLGGLYMATRVSLPINTLLKLKVKLAGEGLQLDGAVVYQDEGEGVGIRFSNLNEEVQAILRRELPAIESFEINVERR